MMRRFRSLSCCLLGSGACLLAGTPALAKGETLVSFGAGGELGRNSELRKATGAADLFFGFHTHWDLGAEAQAHPGLRLRAHALLGSEDRFEPRAYLFVHSARSMRGDSAFGLGAAPSISASGVHPALFANVTFLGFLAFELGVRTGVGQPRVSGSLQFDLAQAVMYAVARSGVFTDY